MVYLREFGPKEKIHNVERNPTGKMWIQFYPPNLYFMPLNKCQGELATY